MQHTVVRACALIVAVAFALAGGMKFVDPSGFATALEAIGFHTTLVSFGTVLIPAFEIAIASAFLLGWASLLRTWLTISVLCTFSIALMILHAVGDASACGCFGRIVEEWAGGSLAVGLARNAVLALCVIVAGMSVGIGVSAGSSKYAPMGCLFGCLTLPIPQAAAVVAMDIPIAPWTTFGESKWSSEIRPNMLDLLIETFALDENQRALAEIFYEDHQTRFRTFVRESRLIEEELDTRIREAESQEQRLRLRIDREEELAPIADKQVQLDVECLEQWKSLLIEDQVDQWETFHRRIRRMIYLRHVMPHPESRIDLIALLNELELDPADPECVIDQDLLADTLTEYEVRMDALLKAKIRHEVQFHRSMERKRQRLSRAQAPVYEYDDRGVAIAWTPADPEFIASFGKEVEDRTESGLAVYQLNRAYRHRLRSLLVGSHAVEFDAVYEQWALRGVWNPDWYPCVKLMNQIRIHPMTDDAQEEWLDQMYMDYLTRSRRIAKKVLQLSSDRALALTSPMPFPVFREFERRDVELQNELNQLSNWMVERLWSSITVEMRESLDRPEPLPMKKSAY